MESLNINEELAKRREELIQVVERLAQLGSLLSGEQSKYYRMHRRESAVSHILMVIDTIDNELQKTKESKMKELVEIQGRLWIASLLFIKRVYWY